MDYVMWDSRLMAHILPLSTEIGFWLYDATTMAPRTHYGGLNEVCPMSLPFRTICRWIATGDQDGIVKVWDTRKMDSVLRKIDWDRERSSPEMAMKVSSMSTSHQTDNIWQRPAWDTMLSMTWHTK